MWYNARLYDQEQSIEEKIDIDKIRISNGLIPLWNLEEGGK